MVLNQYHNHLEGLLRLRVAGTIPLIIDNMLKIDSTLPDAPRRCPIDDFVELIFIFLFPFINFIIAFNSISSPNCVDVP